MIKKCLITGITGQVGSFLADFLLENTDYEIYGMMRWQEPLNNIHHLADRINLARSRLDFDHLHGYASSLNQKAILASINSFF